MPDRADQPRRNPTIECGVLADENEGSAPLPRGPMPTHGSDVQDLEVWSTSVSTEVDWTRWWSDLLASPALDIDAIEVEVSRSREQGIAYNYKGQRAGRPHLATWATLTSSRCGPTRSSSRTSTSARQKRRARSSAGIGTAPISRKGPRPHCEIGSEPNGNPLVGVPCRLEHRSPRGGRPATEKRPPLALGRGAPRISAWPRAARPRRRTGHRGQPVGTLPRQPSSQPTWCRPLSISGGSCVGE